VIFPTGHTFNVMEGTKFVRIYMEVEEEVDLTGSGRSGCSKPDGVIVGVRDSSGRWSPAEAPRAGDNQAFLCASRRHSRAGPRRPPASRSTAAPPRSYLTATMSSCGAPWLGRPPPGARAWPARAHRGPWGARPGGGINNGKRTPTRQDCPV
jgi:hypothetical protein